MNLNHFLVADGNQAVALKVIDEVIINLVLVEVMAVNPRRLLRLAPVSIVEGAPADLTLIDPAKTVKITPEYLQSRSKNSAWLGQELTGVATDVWAGGRRVLTDGVVTPQH